MFKDIAHMINEDIAIELMSHCVYQYSRERAGEKLKLYRPGGARRLYGWVVDGDLRGLCGFEPQGSGTEITHIAVSPAHRGRGIGRQMVESLCRLRGYPIFAETDDEAVDFYRKCGFTAERGGESGAQRWTCTLTDNLNLPAGRG